MSESSKQTAVITVVGCDRVGIIAGVSGLLAASMVNIKDISQTILQGIFTMIMLVEIGEMTIDIKDLADRLDILGQELGLSIRVQHSDIFDAMHRI
jgi:ACT domain-containing protein